MKYFSRRNFVTDADEGVRKHFDSLEDWQHELYCLRALENTAFVPRVLHSLPGLLLLERLSGHTLLDELEAQEAHGFCPKPWQALANWLNNVHQLTGMVPDDGNLRNYIWNAGDNRLSGIDLEHLHQGHPPRAAAAAAAFILEYNPAGTPVKQKAAAILADTFSVSPKSVDAARSELRKRRAARRPETLEESFSFALLTGGHSSRMGCDKAALSLLGARFEAHQLEKAHMLGVSDVLIGCGSSAPEDKQDNVRYTMDALPDRGPLGGLHACLSQAQREHCIVLGIDTPLVPSSLLRGLAHAHLSSGADATLASHGEKYEPLIAVYRTALASQILPLIRNGGASVRALLKGIRTQLLPMDAPEIIWHNCNTPENYQSMLNMDCQM